MVEISNEDRKKICDLFFFQRYSHEDLEKYFNYKYKYSQIKSVISKRLSEYNGKTN